MLYGYLFRGLRMTCFVLSTRLPHYRYLFFFFLIIRHPPRSPLFPSPPLFRSAPIVGAAVTVEHPQHARAQPAEGVTRAELELSLRAVAQPGDDESQQPGRRRTVLFEEREELRSEEHTSELQSQSNLVCRLLLE